MVVYYANELYHHGVQGQKWGVRRYQNPDGTLTEEGRKRYLKDTKKQYGPGIKSVARQINLRSKFGKNTTDRDIESLKDNYRLGNAVGGVLAELGSGVYGVAAISAMISGLGALPVGVLTAKSAVYGALGTKWLKDREKFTASVDEIKEYAKVRKDPKGLKSDQGDQYYRDKAKKYGLDKGDNYKMFRDADQGDAKAKAAVEKWKKDKIDSKVKRAITTDKFDMEFLERNLDVDDRTGETLKGKALENAYRKYLEEEYSK